MKKLTGLLFAALLAVFFLAGPAFSSEEPVVTQDESGNINIPPGYEFTPVSEKNIADKVLAAISLFSTNNESDCYKGLRICKSILKLESSAGVVISHKNNVRLTVLPAAKKSIGENRGSGCQA